MKQKINFLIESKKLKNLIWKSLEVWRKYLKKHQLNDKSL